jgi:hypothetical protein
MTVLTGVTRSRAVLALSMTLAFLLSPGVGTAAMRPHANAGSPYPQGEIVLAERGSSL